jgi:hypothetical protein
MRVQRPPEPQALDPDASTLLDVRPEILSPREAEEEPLEETYPADDFSTEDEEDAPGINTLAEMPTLYPRRSPETPLPETILPPTPRRPLNASRIARVLLAGALISFLLATGLLAFLLVGKHQMPVQATQPRLMALPGELRVDDVLQLSGSNFDAHHVVSLTRDSGLALLDAQGHRVSPTTDARGAFQVHLPVTSTWTLGTHTLRASEGQLKVSTTLTVQAAAQGAPHLQLGASPVDLGAGNPGTLSHKNITLTNTGGGRVTWSAQSDAPWLTLSPGNGTFSGNTVVVVTVNRANLAPQAYVGHLLFTQNGGSAQTLAVSMTVDTTAANLILSTASLTFGGTPAQSPAGQTIVIQNNGGQPLNWTAGNATMGGGNWLSVTPASGLLDANTSAILTVNVDTRQMALGTYQGSLSFSYAAGQAQQVAITLNVTPPPQPAMQISQQSLSFSTTQGTNPPAQSLTITNSGNATLNWAIQADANGQTYLAISPVKGSVPPGQNTRVTVTPQLGSASGTIKSTLTIIDSDTGTTVPPQQVNVSIAITNEPVITLVTGNMTFDHTSDNPVDSDSLIFTDSGSLPLNWTIVESAQVPWLTLGQTSGPLAVGHSTNIAVTCDSSKLQPGTYTVTLTIKDSSAGSAVAPQSVTVTLVVTA